MAKSIQDGIFAERPPSHTQIDRRLDLLGRVLGEQQQDLDVPQGAVPRVAVFQLLPQQIERFSPGLALAGAGIVQTAWLTLQELEIVPGIQDELSRPITTLMDRHDLALPLDAVLEDPALLPVHLGLFPRLQLQRQEHLFLPRGGLLDVPRHRPVMTRETILLPQTLVDLLGRLTLLGTGLPVLLPPRVDDPLDRFQDRVGPGLAPPIPRRKPQGQRLRDRLAGMTQRLRRVPLTEPVDQYLTPNQPLVLHRPHPF